MTAGDKRICADGSDVGFVSPHFDDVALSAADALSRAIRPTVVTVFSGGPQRPTRLADWDVASGAFTPGDDVIAMRTREDDAALELVDGRGARLGLCSGQYRSPSSPSLLARALVAARLADSMLLERAPRLQAEASKRLGEAVDMSGCSRWFFPLGIGHRDHRLTAVACAAVACARPGLICYVYEDLPYAAEASSDEIGKAQQRYRRAGLQLGRCEERLPSPDFKTRLTGSYESQLGALGERATISVSTPERYRRLNPV